VAVTTTSDGRGSFFAVEAARQIVIVEATATDDRWNTDSA
jgi:hypothetical protein